MEPSTNNPFGVISDSLAGRVALVTGGSRGIGRAACLALAAKGAAVAVHYRSQPEAANAVVQQITGAGGKAVAIQADLAQREAPKQVVEQAVMQVGPLDILVNNAGLMSRSAITDLSDDMWDETIAVNLTAVYKFIQACLPSMKERGWGRIINVSSQVTETGSVNHAHYAASKSGLIGLTYSLAKEIGEIGITVNMVAPGRIVTDLIRANIPKREQEWLAQTPLRRFGEPEEVGAVIAFLASPAAAYITGATIHVNGGLVMS
ncbi:MAG: SDR family oxidoreductase [Anaerolineae bacterium]|nr:SDR family oxidoreductase [Anaerolineae bacterium]